MFVCHMKKVYVPIPPHLSSWKLSESACSRNRGRRWRWEFCLWAFGELPEGPIKKRMEGPKQGTQISLYIMAKIVIQNVNHGLLFKNKRN